MKLYLAGNFPIMGSIEKERLFQDYMKKNHHTCYRLGSFYYKKYLNNLLCLKDEENGKTCQEKTRKKRTKTNSKKIKRKSLPKIKNT